MFNSTMKEYKFGETAYNSTQIYYYVAKDMTGSMESNLNLSTFCESTLLFFIPTRLGNKLPVKNFDT